MCEVSYLDYCLVGYTFFFFFFSFLFFKLVLIFYFMVSGSSLPDDRYREIGRSSIEVFCLIA